MLEWNGDVTNEVEVVTNSSGMEWRHNEVEVVMYVMEIR